MLPILFIISVVIVVGINSLKGKKRPQREDLVDQEAETKRINTY